MITIITKRIAIKVIIVRIISIAIKVIIIT